MTCPRCLWRRLHDWSLLKEYMNCAARTIQEYISYLKGEEVTPGTIVVLHTFGKDMKFNPHLHLLVTEGGFDKNNEFIRCTKMQSMPLGRKWEYCLLRNLRLRNLSAFYVYRIYWRYPAGFYVWARMRGRMTDVSRAAKYVCRYVRHPAVASRRVLYCNNVSIIVKCKEESNKYISLHMSIDKFISSLVQHIPPSQFKMIRHYGAYARTMKRKDPLDIPLAKQG
jgi:hypothetical protein